MKARLVGYFPRVWLKEFRNASFERRLGAGGKLRVLPTLDDVREVKMAIRSTLRRRGPSGSP